MRRNTGKMDFASSTFILPPSSRESDKKLKARGSRIELLPVEHLPTRIDVLSMEMFHEKYGEEADFVRIIRSAGRRMD
jgi:hypothetical protein